MNYEEIFNQINLTKDKYQISNLLWNLVNLKPEEKYIDNLIILTEKQYNIKTTALSILSKHCSPEKLEIFVLEKIKTETNKKIICDFIKILHLNGTEKSSEFLLQYYKSTKSRDIKGSIVHALEKLWIRNRIENQSMVDIYKLIGNKFPFFKGYWSEIKKAKITTKYNWKEIAENQLATNNLNLIFEYSNEINIHIQIEKMNANFIRYINLTGIYKNYKSSFSKYFIPSEFYQSENRLFDTIFEKSKQMRLDFYAEGIINIIEIELLPKLIEKINTINLLKEITFSDFEINQNSIFNSLYGTNSDWILAHQLTESIDLFNKNTERNKFIDFVIEKWKVCDKESFGINNYLEEQKK